MPDELLVYDLKSHRAHCLNQTAAFIWNHCDGRTEVPALAGMLAERLGGNVDNNVVWLALEQLGSLDLLQGQVRYPDGVPKLSRRDAMKGLGLAAAAVPLILSVASPTAA